LTKTQAEATLRRAFEAASLEQPVRERLDIEEAGDRYIDRLESLGRKKTTISDYRSTLRVHLVPFFAGRSLDRIDVRLIEAFITAKQREGKAPKSISNYTGLLYSIFAYAERRGWARANPVALADKPRSEPRHADIRLPGDRGTRGADKSCPRRRHWQTGPAANGTASTSSTEIQRGHSFARPGGRPIRACLAR
jgi:hypothetical protein